MESVDIAGASSVAACPEQPPVPTATPVPTETPVPTPEITGPGSAEREFNASCYDSATTLLVSIRPAPPSGASVVSCEDTPPEGWTVSNISHNGVWDSAGKTVKYPVFVENLYRTVSYVVQPPASASEAGEAAFAGTVVFDAEPQDILGASSLNPCNPPPTPTPTPIPRMDSDGDGIDDLYESQWGSNPSDPQSIPSILDFNQDGRLTVLDALLFSRALPPAQRGVRPEPRWPCGHGGRAPVLPEPDRIDSRHSHPSSIRSEGFGRTL